MAHAVAAAVAAVVTVLVVAVLLHAAIVSVRRRRERSLERALEDALDVASRYRRVLRRHNLIAEVPARTDPLATLAALRRVERALWPSLELWVPVGPAALAKGDRVRIGRLRCEVVSTGVGCALVRVSAHRTLFARLVDRA